MDLENFLKPIVNKINNKGRFEYIEDIREFLPLLDRYFNTITILDFGDFYIIDANDEVLLSITEKQASEIGIETIF